MFGGLAAMKAAECAAHFQRLQCDPVYRRRCRVEECHRKHRYRRTMRTLLPLMAIGVWLVLMWNFS